MLRGLSNVCLLRAPFSHDAPRPEAAVSINSCDRHTMITVTDVTKRFGSVTAVDDVNLHIEAGSIHGVLGRSGAGKSTLLRLVNLLERPDHGHITVDGTELTTLDHNTLRRERTRMGMVFQHFRLLANRTVAANVELPLKLHGVRATRRRARVAELLDLVGLPDKAAAYPAQLSGGQRQRVAIARALAPEPRILLSDEATSALDPQTTVEILDLLTRLRSELDVTILLITHELDVVTRICDSASVMADGAVVESGPVTDLLASRIRTWAPRLSGSRPHRRATARPWTSRSPVHRWATRGRAAGHQVRSRTVHHRCRGSHHRLGNRRAGSTASAVDRGPR